MPSLMSIPVFCLFHGLYVIFCFFFSFFWGGGGSSVILDCERGGTQRQCLFPHCVQPLVCSKQTLIDTLAGQDKNGSGDVGLPGSYLLPGLRLLMVTTYQGGRGGVLGRLTYGDWPFEFSLVGRADFLEARAATRPTSPRCTASSSF